MRIAAKATLFVGAGYLVTVCALALAVQHRVSTREEELSNRAAHLVGEEIAAALSEASLARILRADPATRTHLRRLIDGLNKESSLLSSVTVVNERGTVVASDVMPVGAVAPAPKDLFGDARDVLHTQDDSSRSHTMLVPLVRADYLAGYLRLSLNDSGLEGLYVDAFQELLVAALFGLLFVGGLGFTLHRELAQHGRTLTQTFEAILLGREPTLPDRRDEFSEALEMAGRLGRELDHARRDEDDPSVEHPPIALTKDLTSATRLRTLTQIYRTLAHELRAPLQAMSIHIDSLRESLKPEDSGAQRDVETLSKELQRLDHSLYNVLAETAPGGDEPGLFDLRALILEVDDLVEGQARSQQIAIEVAVPESPVRIHGYRDRLKQALLNLLMNAFEAQPGGGAVKLSVEATRTEAWLQVDDAGKGIDSAEHDRVFDMHYSTKATGTGIGLTVARWVVEAAGGRVEIGASEAGGARISLVLPKAPEEGDRRA